MTPLITSSSVVFSC